MEQLEVRSDIWKSWWWSDRNVCLWRLKPTYLSILWWPIRRSRSKTWRAQSKILRCVRNWAFLQLRSKVRRHRRTWSLGRSFIRGIRAGTNHASWPLKQFGRHRKGEKVFWALQSVYTEFWRKKRKLLDPWQLPETFKYEQRGYLRSSQRRSVDCQ